MVIVSVIIPVYNDLKAIQLTLQSLREQSSPQNQFEIIIIDNGSTDGSVEWLANQNDVIFLQENIHKGSPYSCRNRGIEIAKGELVTLLDSTCIPDKTWIENGLKYYSDSKYVLFGGKVKFNFDGKESIAKIYDSITNVQMEYSIKNKHEAKTANLWVKKSLFDQVGEFSEGIRSGEDVRWTKHCTNSGIELSYCNACIVYKFARGLKELFIKQIRVGKGQTRIWINQNKFQTMMVKSFKALLLPLRPSSLKLLIARNEDIQYSFFLMIRLYPIAYLMTFASLIGNIIGYFQLETKKN